ncbi:HK97 family phage major capsid protein [Variovorax boronicumulans]|uniref:HK97 family phage major capsid protein n=1 Tax=Variovorax boronicumulans TaxID=436515 RepID=A0AAW8CUA0_9BURK|nr:phage major capsid protein [Variovorax boronicumulans]MDP9891236.1 HK97 family phage major capsid protein [Variovorax boronicumulans]MDQ0051304.1 HK97 family phage major capsid protein [Variovorax boronicumulans]
MSIQALRERLSALNKEGKKLLADKGDQTWSKEDQTKFDVLMDDAERTQRQVEAHQRMLDNEAENNFKDVEKKKGPRDEKVEGFEIFLRKKDREMSAEDAQKVRNAMSTTTGSEGGYTVQPIVAKTLIESLKSYGTMRRAAETIQTENGVDMSWPTTDGTAEEGEIVAQNASANDQDIAFGTRALNVYKFSSKVITVPIELLQDSGIDIVGLVNRRMRSRIGRIQNRLFTVGTGTGEPTGLVTAATVGKIGATGQVTTVTYDDFVDLVDSLDVAYLEPEPGDDGAADVRPGWMFSQAIRKVARKMKDTAGRPIWTPSYDAGISGMGSDELLGYPVGINNYMPAPAANAKSIAFGSMRNYKVRDAMEVTFYRFDDSAYAKKGQVGFLAFCRSGGNLLDLGGVKTYQHSAT